MKFGVVGLSHKSAPIALREKVAFRAEELPKALRALGREAGLSECLILSTCNRVEIYAVPSAGSDFPRWVLEWLARSRRLDVRELSAAAYSMEDEDAVAHAVEVAISLDSMVVGEAEILGQMKDAYRAAREAGTAGPAISRVMERTFQAAKEARSETGIGRGCASVASAAATLASKIFDGLKGRGVLVLGTGAMASCIVKGIAREGAERIFVSSRDIGRAKRFCAEAGAGEPRDRESGLKLLSEVDVVLASSDDAGFALRREKVEEAMRLRGGRPLLAVDIAVPRIVDPSANEIPGVFLYDVDDLREVAEAAARGRELAAEECRRQARRRASAIFRELSALRCGNVSRMLMEKARAIQREELARATSRLKALEPSEADEVRKLSARIAARILHLPLSSMRKLAMEGCGEDAAEWAARLFDLPLGGPETCGGETGSSAGGAAPGNGVPGKSGKADRDGAASNGGAHGVSGAYPVDNGPCGGGGSGVRG